MNSAAHTAYDRLYSVDLPELRSSGSLFRHRASGCEIFKITNDDSENSFAFAFRTPSQNGSGAAHIVEHSVLCGSKHYPAKDPFLILARRSLATFLNALTYPDKTVYPAASAVRADFFNLMDVYGDAVFYPLLSRETFLQEAHRYEYAPDGSLDIQGVVYNEMRGDYSSPESLVSTYLTTNLFDPGHPYSFDSGGNPSDIKNISYDDFRAFWARHYSPANCRIGLYGDIPVEDELEFLDSRFLGPLSDDIKAGRLGAGQVGDVPLSGRWERPRTKRLPLPAEESEGSQILSAWLFDEPRDRAEALAFDLISELLLGHDGAPLSRALRDSGLGEDISPQSGYDTNFRQPVFVAGLRGVKDPDAGSAIEKLILSTVADYAGRGPAPGEIETALHSIAFSSKEIRRGFSTCGLRLLFRSLGGWLRGEAPEARLSFDAPLALLKERMAGDSRYLESLMESCLIGNSHRLLLCAYPDQGCFSAAAARSAAELAAKDRDMSPEERAAVRADSGRIAAASRSPDPPDVLAAFPAIRRADLPHGIDQVPRREDAVQGIPLSIHPLFTNGIVYLDMAFALSGLADSHYDWLPLLCRYIEGCGTKRLSYDLMASSLARNSGGFSLSCEAGTDSSGSTQSFIIVRIKALEDHFAAAAALAFELLSSADFSDEKRLADLLAELGNDSEASIIPGGSSYAALSAAAGINRASALSERMQGLSQILFLRRLRQAGEAAGKAAGPAQAAADAKTGLTGSEALWTGPGGIAGILEELSRAVFAREGLRLSLSGSPDCLDAARRDLEASLSGLRQNPAPLPALPDSSSAPFPCPGACCGFELNSDVGFAAAACPCSGYGSPGSVHESVLFHLLSTGPLWQSIRVRQGAYGASASSDPLEGIAVFSSYRDPKPNSSLAAFDSALSEIAQSGTLDGAAADEAVAGTLAREIKPQLPAERALADFRRELYGIDDADRAERREILLKTGEEDIRAAAVRMQSRMVLARRVLISGQSDIELLLHERPGAMLLELSKQESGSS